MTLQDYQNELKGKDCKWCRSKNYETHITSTVSLEREPIESYDHQGGYRVEGFSKLQWLYVTCPNCGYQWSLGKLINISTHS